jgi:hypothetical protein
MSGAFVLAEAALRPFCDAVILVRLARMRHRRYGVRRT